ncbi:MAG: VWA domain-containing protein [bacterium]
MIEFVNLTNIWNWLIISIIWLGGLILFLKILFSTFRNSHPEYQKISTFRKFPKLITSIISIMMLLLILILTTIILLRPFLGKQTISGQIGNTDIIFLIDQSASMGVEDIRVGSKQISRLEASKNEIKSIIGQDLNSRIAMVVFADQARMVVPFTSDQTVLLGSLDNLELLGSKQAKGSSLLNALNYLFDQVIPTEQKNQHPVKVVIFSDGEQVGVGSKQELTAIFQKIKTTQVEIFSVGTGTVSGGKVPVVQTKVNPYITEKQYYYQFKINSDNTSQKTFVISSLQASTLQTIATQSGGKYFELISQKNWNQLVASLQSKDTKDTIQKQEYFLEKYYFLTPILLILLMIWQLRLFDPIFKKNKLNI